MFVLILLYLAIGFVFACANCAIHGTPTPPDMSEKDKNMFVLIVAFWAFIIPFKFIRRLYIAIRASLAKNKLEILKIAHFLRIPTKKPAKQQ